MKIVNLSNSLFINYLPVDENLREVNIFKLKQASIIDVFYPNCLIISNNNIYNPINERIMSIGEIDIKLDLYSENMIENIECNPVFFFIYNTDNYYHFVYDTLPYLISYRYMKSKIPNIKLLMSYPNSSRFSFYKFVIEFLEILDITDKDILIANDYTVYNEIYISSSYTHGEDSNKPPRKEIYSFYKDIVSIVNNKFKDKEYPKKIYISRRTWLHNDFSNIGTNYTTRRKLVNEDELVEILVSNGYVEVFTESLSTVDKIKLFYNAESIVGAIGGGICNVLFSKDSTNLLALISPTFLDVNSRFIFSLNNVNTEYFFDSKHVEENEWKKYIRVKTNDGIIGEIEDLYDDNILISYTNKFVAGWNSEVIFEKKIVNKKDCIRLDNGLNSSWIFNINSIENKI